LGKVIGLLHQAERAKPPITRLLERYAGQYMLLVLLIAAVTWFVTNDAQAMLAVLVAACPCALVLSAPATAIAGIAVAGADSTRAQGQAATSTASMAWASLVT
ncbi:P-type ATPase, partial [Pseudomonas aeruginosa]